MGYRYKRVKWVYEWPLEVLNVSSWAWHHWRQIPRPDGVNHAGWRLLGVRRDVWWIYQ